MPAIEEVTGWTINECRAFVDRGEVPENLTQRLTVALGATEDGTYWCRNCGGVEDMNVVFRAWYEDEPSWCPDCRTQS